MIRLSEPFAQKLINKIINKLIKLIKAIEEKKSSYINLPSKCRIIRIKINRNDREISIFVDTINGNRICLYLPLTSSKINKSERIYRNIQIQQIQFEVRKKSELQVEN